MPATTTIESRLPTALSILTTGLALIALVTTSCSSQNIIRRGSSSPEASALAFLAREVPAWKRDNGCYSCHNNGDAARALFQAQQIGLNIPKAALADTVKWVSQPQNWDDNQGDPGFSDQSLADIQFASSLLAAMDAGEWNNDDAVRKAALRVAGQQAENGAWPIGSEDTLGAPATYGTALATHMALQVLQRANLPEHTNAIQRGQAWLLAHKPQSVLDASVQLLFLHASSTSPPPRKVAECLGLLRRSQTTDGGWGPFPDTPPEAFDTAIALLALVKFAQEPEAATMIRHGRQFLIALQNADGSWPATTRPARNESYAEMMSTSGWATLALLATGSQTAP